MVFLVNWFYSPRAHAVTQHFDEINKMYICVHFTEYSIFYLTSLGITKTNTNVYFYVCFLAFFVKCAFSLSSKLHHKMSHHIMLLAEKNNTYSSSSSSSSS